MLPDNDEPRKTSAAGRNARVVGQVRENVPPLRDERQHENGAFKGAEAESEINSAPAEESEEFAPARASTRAALWCGGAIACALLGFLVSRAIKPKPQPFTFNAATPVATPLPAPLRNAQSSSQDGREDSRRALAAPKTAATPRNLIVVHVAGAVKKPGVYKMPRESRIYQAIARAGGAKSSADTNALNMAAHLEDAVRIEVPTKTETREYSRIETAPRESFAPRKDAPHVSTSASPRREKTTAPRVSSAKARAAEIVAKLRANPVNLNSASAQELETLPGIGPAMAGRILEFRAENGGFSSVDELDEVRGIGPKTLEKLRPLVRVN